MIVKIEDVSFLNKGASLMLVAIIKKLKEIYGKELIIVVDRQIGNRELIAKYNLFHEAQFQRFKIAHIIPTSQLKPYFLVNPKDIDIILNASGFSLGDQWTPYPKNFLSRKIEKYNFYKKNGTKIVFLPQAFGPFTNPELKNYVKKLEIIVDLIFARDQTSYDHLNEIINKKSILKIAPDFTNGFEVENKEIYKDHFIIIPNHKMFAKTNLKEDEYIQFLVKITQHVQSKGIKVVLLNHEGPLDKVVIDKIARQLIIKPFILNELPPDQIKSIIKSAYGILTSRYHGAVSALSQGVPVLITSWSHKYKELLSDYKSEDALLKCSLNYQEACFEIEKILNKEENKKIRRHLFIHSEEQKDRTKQMWEIVFNNI